SHFQRREHLSSQVQTSSHQETLRARPSGQIRIAFHPLRGWSAPVQSESEDCDGCTEVRRLGGEGGCAAIADRKQPIEGGDDVASTRRRLSNTQMLTRNSRRAFCSQQVAKPGKESEIKRESKERSRAEKEKSIPR